MRDEKMLIVCEDYIHSMKKIVDERRFTLKSRMQLKFWCKEGVEVLDEIFNLEFSVIIRRIIENDVLMI